MPKKKLKQNKKIDSNSNSSKNTVEDQRSFAQNFWIYIGYIGGVLAIVVFTFQVGHHFGFSDAKKYEFKHFSEYLNQINDGVNLVNVTCTTTVFKPGDKCEIVLKIENKTPYECDLWVGASAIDSSGNEIWNRSQDRIVTITANGITSTKRYLTFPDDTHDGDYDIQINIWYGKKGDPSQSELISSAALRRHVSIKSP